MNFSDLNNLPKKKSQLTEVRVKQALDFPCCNKHSWAYITLELDRVNSFCVTCKQCRAVYVLEVRPIPPVRDNGFTIRHPVRWYPDLDYGLPPCKAIPRRVITPYKPMEVL